MINRRGFLRNSMAVTACLGGSGIDTPAAIRRASTPAIEDGPQRRRYRQQQAELSRRLKTLTGSATWSKTAEVPMNFRSFHPQGMVRIDDHYYVSSVEIVAAPVKYQQAVDGCDRSTGAGKGHLFKVDLQGNLLADLPIGEGSMYHPGGCDFDGRYIWVPAAEYRPHGRGLVYRIDPESMSAVKVLEFPDHLGACALNVDDNTVHAINWGGRDFYQVKLNAESNQSEYSTATKNRNNTFYIDYQDNKYLYENEMLYTGLNSYAFNGGDNEFRLGGLEIVNLKTGMAVYQVPIKLWSPVTGRAMTNNPTTFELTAAGVRGYFMPDDDTSILYIYEVTTS